MEQTGVFDVDLRGLIDVLGTNLYSTPGVFVRELLQNAIDAQRVRGTAETPIEITADGAEFLIVDHGVGMSEEQIAGLLGTIGRSSKRDALGFSDQETIGQFGVGLLSGFLAGDRIEVSSKAEGSAPVRWIGDAAGAVWSETGDRSTVGTTVRIVARPGMERWLQAEAVAALAAEYTALNRTPVLVNGQRVNPPQDLFADNPGMRAAAQVAFCQEEFGFTPLDSVELSVPQAGLRGIAFVRPSGGDLVRRDHHRVYLKGLLVGDVADLVPEWAYFVRVVVLGTGLTPTASRESLIHDDLFHEVADAVGTQVHDWLTGLAARPELREKFLAVHEQGIKGLAVHRPELLDFVDRFCEFETNYGPMPLATFRARFTDLRYTGSVDDFRVLADILGGRGFGLVNAGYAFESAVIRTLLRTDPRIVGEHVTQEVLLAALGDTDSATRDRFADVLTTAETTLAAFDCDVALTSVDPDTLSALLLTDDSAKLAHDRREMLEAADETDVWLAAVAAIDHAQAEPPSTRPVLVLNVANELVARLPGVSDPVVVGALVRTILGQALIRARRSLPHALARDVDSAIMLLADLATRPTSA
ncbi:HSP90 family protein [Gordonia hydrophobica]|uniref:HSP90 family protein n=1 Tax=Gordonia hydrophobica TaxID=40516 RepID=A0ABZ2U5S9_9ACTN|nr:HSP90 family protein [Gordonia hydrophobica]MBM7365665.1 molecular chaperone HtpG [Gordonia hydrophobica]